MNTGPLQKNISRVFPNRTAAILSEALLLMILGMIAVIIQSKLRIPMHLPGKQGVIFIALIVMGRGLSQFSFAASLTCIGSATLLATGLFSSHDPFMAVNYILLGGVMDLIYRFTTYLSERQWVAVLASGVAWMFMPLFKMLVSLAFIVPMNSFSTGIAYPFITHLIFGITGGLIGAGILKISVSDK